MKIGPVPENLIECVGTRSQAELASWQQDAGLMPLKPIRLRTIPGASIQAAHKG